MNLIWRLSLNISSNWTAILFTFGHFFLQFGAFLGQVSSLWFLTCIMDQIGLPPSQYQKLLEIPKLSQYEIKLSQKTRQNHWKHTWIYMLEMAKIMKKYCPCMQHGVFLNFQKNESLNFYKKKSSIWNQLAYIISKVIR